MKIGESIISRLIVWVYYLFGQWPNEDASLFYHIYSFVLHFGFVFIYLICMLINLIFITDVNETTHSLYVTLTELAFFLKVLNFFWFNRGMKECMSTVIGFDLKDEKEAETVRKRMQFFNWLTYSYYIIPNLCAITASMKPLFVARREIPFRGWYPLDWVNDDRNYVLVYAYQVIGILIEVNLNVTLDVYPNFLMHMISIQIQILGNRLKNLGSTSNGHVVSSIDPTDALQKSGTADLTDCIKTHQKIISLIALVETNFTAAFFTQICISGTVMCSLAYQLTYTSPIDSPFEYFFYCIYIVCIVTQIFLPCYFGNEVIFTGNSLSNWAYASAWYSFSLNYRKILFVFMERLKRKSEILAGKLFPLSLDTFTSIVNFSYRLYTVIISMNPSTG